MIALARDLARAGEPVLNLLFHSSEAIVGGSPYNRTQAELDAFCDRLDRFLAFADDVSWAPRRYVRRIPPRVRAADAHPSRHAAPAAGSGGQRAAALAARRTGRASAATRSSTSRIRRARAARAELAGPVTWIPRRSGGILRSHAAPRTRLLGALAHAARARARDRARGCRARAQQRAACRRSPCCSRGAPAKPVVLTLYGTEIWHYEPKRGRPDLFTRAYHGGVIRHVLQRSADEPGARARARPAQRTRRVPAGRREVSHGTTTRRKRQNAPRSASATATCC